MAREPTQQHGGRVRVRYGQRATAGQGQRPRAGAAAGGQPDERSPCEAGPPAVAAGQSARAAAHVHQPADRGGSSAPLRDAAGRPRGLADDARGVRAGAAAAQPQARSTRRSTTSWRAPGRPRTFRPRDAKRCPDRRSRRALSVPKSATARVLNYQVVRGSGPQRQVSSSEDDAQPDQPKRKPRKCEAFRDGASETRTRDLLGAIQALSQLSYSPATGGL